MIGWTMDHTVPIRFEVVSRDEAERRGYAVPPNRSSVRFAHLDGPVEIPEWPAYHLPHAHELDALMARDPIVSVPLPRDIRWRLEWEAIDREAGRR